MKPMVFKLRSVRAGDRISTTIFSGMEGQTLANTGTLIQTIGEYQLFGAMLGLGADASHGHGAVIFEGDPLKGYNGEE